MSEQTVLFDAPGPRALRRYRIVAGAGGAVSLLVLAWVLVKLGEKGNLAGAKWSPFLQPVTWTEYIVPGLIGTLKAAAISIVLAGVLGLLLGAGRLSKLAAAALGVLGGRGVLPRRAGAADDAVHVRAVLHEQRVPAVAALAWRRSSPP